MIKFSISATIANKINAVTNKDRVIVFNEIITYYTGTSYFIGEVAEKDIKPMLYVSAFSENDS